MESDELLYPLTVFYDASCPLCANEMHALRDLDTSGHLELVDCSGPDFREDDLPEGITQETLMARIHARDPLGTWVVGLDCFEAVYRAAGLESAARVWGDPRLRPLLDGLYPWIARNRQMLSKLGISALVRFLIPKPRRPSTCTVTRECGTGPER